jgi:hypothetical protein
MWIEVRWLLASPRDLSIRSLNILAVSARGDYQVKELSIARFDCYAT